MKKPFLIIISFCCVLASFGQETINSYRWHHYGIEVLTEEKMTLTGEDTTLVCCDGIEANLYITKEKCYIPRKERKEYLMRLISSNNYSVIGKIKEEMKDSIIVYSARVENNKCYGFYFLFSDTLVNNNIFIGSMTTGSKPKADILKLIDFKTFPDNFNYPQLPNRVGGSPIVKPPCIETTKVDTSLLIIGKENIRYKMTELYNSYSKDVSSLMKSYNSLPEKMGAKPIGVHVDFTRFFKDTVDLNSLYLNSTFAHETYHNTNGWISTMQSIKKTRGNYTDRIYSYYFSDTCIVNVDKVKVLPANIIHKSYPSVFKNDTYSLYIYPSSLDNATQTDGIYALIDEFGAYIYSAIWQNDFLQFYYDRAIINELFLGRYLVSSIDDLSYSILFKHYIVHYLMILKSASPELYTQLMGDANIKKAIRLQNQRLNDQITLFNHKKNKIREDLANEYIAYIENEKELNIGDHIWDNADITKANKLIEYINSLPEYQKIFTELGCEPTIPILMIKEE